MAVFAAYVNSFAGIFQFDDYNVIVNNPAVHSWAAWWTDIRHGVRQLLKFTYTLNWTSGMGMFGFHLFNLCVHGVNVILVYVLSLGLIPEHSSEPTDNIDNIAFTTALLFALHPVQTEAVTYISSRSTSLMSLFYMSSFLAYIHGRNTGRSFLLYIVSPILFVMGLATKETAVTLPAALILWEISSGKKPRLSAFKKSFVHWLMLAAVLCLFLFHTRYYSLLLFSLDLRSFHDNFLSQLHGAGYLLSRLVFVHELNIDPDLPNLSRWSTALVLETGFLTLLLISGIYNLRRQPLIAFGILWFFLHLLAVNMLVPRIDITNERHFYLAGWGIFLVLSMGIVKVFSGTYKKKRFMWLSIIFLALILGCFTIKRNNLYRSEIALWEDVIKKSPNKARGYNNLGYAYKLAGDTGKAESFYLKALELAPDFTRARNNLLSLEKEKN